MGSAQSAELEVLCERNYLPVDPVAFAQVPLHLREEEERQCPAIVSRVNEALSGSRDRDDCPGCGGPRLNLTVRRAHISGSTADRLAWITVDVEGRQHREKVVIRSDRDYMLDVGSVDLDSGAARVRPGHCLGEQSRRYPGFFRVFRPRASRCQHSGRLPLAAADVKAVMSAALGAGQVSGPAIALPGLGAEGSRDYVTCLKVTSLGPDLAGWLEAIRDRTRPAGWPSDQLLNVLNKNQTIHLVPKGPTEADTTRWRVSFSRPEAVLAKSLPGRQRYHFILMKAVKKRCGEQAQLVRSYYLKTAVFWLSETRSPAKWKDNIGSMEAILDLVGQAAADGFLSCYFLPSLNIFTGHDASKLASIAEHVQYIRTHLAEQLYNVLTLQ